MNKPLWIVLAICAAGFAFNAKATSINVYKPVIVNPDLTRGQYFKRYTKCNDKIYLKRYVKCVCEDGFRNCKANLRGVK